MANKVRKPRSSNPRTYSQTGPQLGQVVAPPQSSTTTAAARSTVSTGAQSTQSAKPAQTVDLAVEYSYVGKELRRLAITATVLIALEIVLNLVLRQVL